VKRAVLLTALTVLAACGGRSGTGVIPKAAGAAASVPIAFSIRIPLASGARTARVSSATDGVGVTTYLQTDTGHTTPIGYFGNDVSASAPNCSTVNFARVCSIQAAAPAGADTFVVTTYDGAPDVSGGFSTASALDSGAVNATIVQGQSNAVAVTLGGIPAVLQLSIDNPNASYDADLYGTMPYTLEVTALDASGAQIIGTDPYANPITITPQSANATVTVNGSAGAAVTSPADRVVLTDASPSQHFWQVQASASGASGATATYTVESLGQTSSSSTASAPAALAAGTDADLYYGDAADEIVRFDLHTGTGTALSYAGSSPQQGPAVAIVRNTFAGVDASWVTQYDGTGVWVGNTDGTGPLFNAAEIATGGDCSIANGHDGDRWLGCVDGSIVDSDSGARGTSTGDAHAIGAGPDGLLWWLADDPTHGMVVEEEAESDVGTGTPSILATLDAAYADNGEPPLMAMCPDKFAYAALDTAADGAHIVAIDAGGTVSTPAALAGPASAIACGPNGDLYVGEAGGAIQRYAGGTVATVVTPSSGNRIGGLALGPDGAMWATVTATAQLVRIIP